VTYSEDRVGKTVLVGLQGEHYNSVDAQHTDLTLFNLLPEGEGA